MIAAVINIPDQRLLNDPMIHCKPIVLTYTNKGGGCKPCGTKPKA